jgi:hypothetical protein
VAPALRVWVSTEIRACSLATQTPHRRRASTAKDNQSTFEPDQ